MKNTPAERAEAQAGVGRWLETARDSHGYLRYGLTAVHCGFRESVPWVEIQHVTQRVAVRGMGAGLSVDQPAMGAWTTVYSRRRG